MNGPQVNPLVNLFPILLMVGIMYLLIIRPQKRREQEHTKMIESLKKHDEIVTMGGVYGTLVHVKDKTFVVRIDDNTKVEIDKSAVARVTKRASS
ncbi:MAG: preprotein translocase subunit YajC [Candidatus Omnitrophica bacterium]|nr:preprotein translocase subunit YajC [Candidatus Omnitrophota bacterium]